MPYCDTRASKAKPNQHASRQIKHSLDATNSYSFIIYKPQEQFFIVILNDHANLFIFYVIIKVYKLGATWLRRGLQNQRCMPRMRSLVNQAQININANDENFAGEAIAA